jgi:hypothetical protein
VLSAGEPAHVNAAYHLWETMTLESHGADTVLIRTSGGRYWKAEHANTTTINTPGGAVPLASDPVVRRRLAGIATEIQALRLLFYRAACLLRDGARRRQLPRLVVERDRAHEVARRQLLEDGSRDHVACAL